MGTNTESVRLIKINISEEHKAFLWTPPKTASEHATTVFSLFNFQGILCDYNRSNIIEYHNVPNHNHNLNFFEGHDDYKLICTARNPIKIMFSAYIFSNRVNKNLSVQGFREFFSKEMYNGNSFWLEGCKFNERVPDYFIRQEQLFQDYLKIPFVRESKITKCGALEELCTKRLNHSDGVNIKINDCYTNDMIDSLYMNYKWYFDTLGYTNEL